MQTLLCRSQAVPCGPGQCAALQCLSHSADPVRPGKVVSATGVGVRTLLADANRGFRTGK